MFKKLNTKIFGFKRTTIHFNKELTDFPETLTSILVLLNTFYTGGNLSLSNMEKVKG